MNVLVKILAIRLLKCQKYVRGLGRSHSDRTTKHLYNHPYVRAKNN